MIITLDEIISFSFSFSLSHSLAQMGRHHAQCRASCETSYLEPKKRMYRFNCPWDGFLV